MSSEKLVMAFDRFLLRCENLRSNVNDDEDMRFQQFLKRLNDDFQNLRINLPEPAIVNYEKRIQNLSLFCNVEGETISQEAKNATYSDTKNKKNTNSFKSNESLQSKHQKMGPFDKFLVQDDRIVELFRRNHIDVDNRPAWEEPWKKIDKVSKTQQSNMKRSVSELIKSNEGTTDHKKSNKLLPTKGHTATQQNKKENIIDKSKELETEEKIKQEMSSNLLNLAKNLKKNFETTSTVIEADANNISNTLESIEKTNTNLQKASKLIAKTSQGICSWLHIFSLIAIWVSFIYCVVLIRFTRVSP